jgi:hypothetical protein
MFDIIGIGHLLLGVGLGVGLLVLFVAYDLWRKSQRNEEVAQAEPSMLEVPKAPKPFRARVKKPKVKSKKSLRRRR